MNRWHNPGAFCRFLSQISSCRAVSTRRRAFYQQLNEEHLARELKNIAVTAQGAPTHRSAPGPVESRPRRGSQVIASKDPWKPPADFVTTPGAEFKLSGPRKPWLEYESMRGSTSRKKPRWQDLTHNETQRMQEMLMRKRMLDRKILWMKKQHLPNPQKDAKMTMRQRQEAELANSAGHDMYPLPFLDMQPNAPKLKKMMDEAQLDMLESRFRNRIRTEKWNVAKSVKSYVPDMAGDVQDPIKRHMERRRLRQRVKLHLGVEEILTANSSQILHEFLKGAAVSIVRISAKGPRKTQNIYYNLLSKHDPVWVQERLNILAPKLQSQVALSVNLGMTPKLRFKPYNQIQQMKRDHLWQYARRIKEEVGAR